MSAQENNYSVKGTSLEGAWKIAAGVGALGVLGALGLGMSDPKRFAFSYLFAFAAVLTVPLGATFFVLLQHITSAAWSVTVRRTAEFFMSGLWVFALLFIPVLVHKDHLYGEWMNLDHGAAHAPVHASAAHGDPPAAAHGSERVATTLGETGGHAAPTHARGHRLTPTEIEHELHGVIMHKKTWYLTTGKFLFRYVLYFALWIFISRSLFRNSTNQDTSKDHVWTQRSNAMAPWAIPVMALSTTFAVFDWYMSLLPSWYSTIFGVYHFAACMVALFSVLTLTATWAQEKGLYGDTVTKEHFHDLGKLLFGFNCFWAYISFSQFFLIWYAGIPEEAEFFHMRWSNGPWMYVSIAICLVHFVAPFVLLMSRNVKRNFTGLKVGAVVLLVMHVVDMYWLIMPNYARAVGVHAHDANSLSFSPLDVLSLVGVAGVFLAAVLYNVAKHPLVAVGDPRFERSRHFENF